MWIAIAITFIICAYLFSSIFWDIMSGLLMVAAGIEFIGRSSEWTYLVFGIAIIAVGLYKWVMVPLDLYESRKGE